MKLNLIVALVAAAASATPARADIISLYTAWQKAMQNEAAWRMAQADTVVDREEENKARAGLLPNLTLSSARSRNDTDRGIVGGTSASMDYTATSSALLLRQPLLRMQNFAEYRRATTQREGSEARQETAAQTLATKVAQAYFDILLAEDGIRFTRFQEASLKIHLDSAEKSLKAGAGTRIDIDEAKARLAYATAERLTAENAHENARKQLAALIGSPVTAVIPVDEGRAAGLKLEPATYAEWLELARQGSPELAAANKAVEEASWAVSKARSGHLPTIDLVASRSRSESDTIATINTRADNSAVGVMLNLPLFAGGYVDADTAQARARQQRAIAEKEGFERDLETRVLREFNGVTQGAERLASLQEAVTAGIVALRSTRRGVEAGTRNTLDVLNTERQLFSARLEAARARYGWLMSRLRLMSLAGRLGDGEMLAANTLLAVSAGQVVDPAVPDETRVSTRRAAGDIPRDPRPTQSSPSKAPAAQTPASLPKSSPADGEGPAPTPQAPSAETVGNAIAPPATADPVIPDAAPVAPQVPPLAELPPAGAAPADQPVPTPKPAVAMPPNMPPKNDGRYAVLIGSFANPDNVSRLLEQLESVKVPVFTESSGSGLIGIRAGPYATRKEAERGLRTLRAANLPGVLSIR